MQLLNPDYTSYYIESVDRLMFGETGYDKSDVDAIGRPVYVLLPERFFDCKGRYYCFEAARHAILNIKD